MAKADLSKIAKLLNAALVHHRADGVAEASQLYRKILRLAPRHAAALHLLAAIKFQQGQVDEAAELAGKALAAKPDFPEALVNLGMMRRHQGRLDEAVSCFERALALQPGYPDALNSLGLTFHALGRVEEAVARYRAALALRPAYPDALNNLGNSLSVLGDHSAAIASFREALACRPGFADALINWGNVLKEQGLLADALAHYRRALASDPNSAAALINSAGVLRDQGVLEEALPLYRRALELLPGCGDAISNLLFALNNSGALTPAALFAEHARLGADLEVRAVAGLKISPHAPPGDSVRRLRIGYVSPDFRAHSVSQFFLPLLAAHDPAAVESFCYADVLVPDAMTARLRGHADHWLSTVGMADAALAERIRADQIDILVDLAGHTAHNRLGVFARRAAPVQGTWLGYPNTTGLPAMDYRLVDAVTDPEGDADVFATERLIRLEGGFLCYGAPEDAPEPSLPPGLETGVVTFGSFNNPAKLSEATVDVWAAILRRLPTARLLLKGQAFGCAETSALTRERFARRGVDGGRVDLMARIAGATGHLDAYRRIDIGLDPIPYNGTTTTCEALWMGVPVVTMLGDRHAARVGASLLGGLWLGELVGGDRSDYVEIAVALAGDPARLSQMRAGLRERMRGSRLCSAPAFARTIEAAYRALWRR